MARTKRHVLEAAEETLTPPASLTDDLSICRVVKAEGQNLYTVEKPHGTTLLVELPSRFRSSIWIKRGSFVLVDTATFAERDNKLDGEVRNVVGDERAWRKMSYWPHEFPKQDLMDRASAETGED